MRAITLVFTIGLFINVAFAQLPINGLVAYFKMNGDAKDMSGKNNHGEVFGATLTYDRFFNPESAYYFDGDDYIKIKNHISLCPKNLTFCGWYKFQNTQGLQLLLDKHISSGSYDSYEMWFENGSLWGTIGRKYEFGPFIETPFKPTRGTWHHLVYSFDNNTNKQKLYINGELVMQTDVNLSIEYDDEPLLLAASNDHNFPHYFYTGAMDDVMIYNRMLNDEEIKKIYEFKETTDAKEVAMSALELKVFPNPTASILNIQANSDFHKIFIYNDLGQLILKKETELITEIVLDISQIITGTYIVEVIGEQKKGTYKLIKL